MMFSVHLQPVCVHSTYIVCVYTCGVFKHAECWMNISWIRWMNWFGCSPGEDRRCCSLLPWPMRFALCYCVVWGEVMTPRVVLQIIRPIDACFSFNTQVKELVRLSLNQPVKLFVDSNTDTAYNLRQEFVRVRTKHEGDREAIVAGTYVTTGLWSIHSLCVTIQLCAFDHSMITVCCFWAPKRTAIACVSFLDYWASRQLNCMATWQCYRYAAVNLTVHCYLFLLPAFGGFKTV